MIAAARLALLLAAGAALAGPAIAAVSGVMPGVEKPDRARQNWMLKCQGCHRADASGTPATTPAMAGLVAEFLSVPDGRAYLAQVPGVATAALPDDQLAELLNWTLYRYDAGHVPADFKPYTTNEIGQLRRKPLRTEAAQVRARIIADIRSAGVKTP